MYELYMFFIYELCVSLGTELVHDDSEKCLLREVENLRTNQKKLEACLDRCKDQVCGLYTLISSLQLINMNQFTDIIVFTVKKLQSFAKSIRIRPKEQGECLRHRHCLSSLA